MKTSDDVLKDLRERVERHKHLTLAEMKQSPEMQDALVVLPGLLDDADELARLREGIRCEIAVFQQYDLMDEADRLAQLLDNGDGDVQES